MNKYRFNFGILRDNLEANSIKILPDTIYSEELGYGLEHVAQAVCRETGEDRRFIDFLVADNNKFKVKLEKGHYNLRITVGDYDDDGDITAKVSINGEAVGGIWITDRTICNRIFPINSEGGLLEIEFSCRFISTYPRVVPLNMIDIAPVYDEKVEELKYEVKVNKESATVRLNWQQAQGAHDYKICKRDLQRNILVTTYEIKEPVLYDTDAEACKAYEYIVYARDEYGFEGEAQSIQVEVVDGKNPPKMPQTLLVEEVLEERVSLSWEKIEEAIEYIIYQKTNLSLFKEIGRTKSTSFVDENTHISTEFIYAVAAKTTSGITEKVSVTVGPVGPVLKRKMEKLDRGLVAVKTGDGVFLSWRLNAYEYEQNVGFNLYRNNQLLNNQPITKTTNYFDSDGSIEDQYCVKGIFQGKEEQEGYRVGVLNTPYLPIPIDKPDPYKTPDGKMHEYSANDIAVGDLDGDGEYELVLKWDAGSHDNAHAGYTGAVYLDAYKLNGKKLWRIDLGVNIRAGAHYTQMIVYDLDGDGKAEVVCKTADGTIDGLGNILGNRDADYRNKDGYIIEGPEYLSAFDGETGAFLDTVPYDPPRGNVAEWGDSWGNRVDRFLAAVAYLDGQHPSVVMCRGYYDHGRPTVLVAYDLKNKKLEKRWKFLANSKQNIEYTNQGNHNIAIGDIDGDGKDEIVYGACAIDHDGTGIYSTQLGHGDALHMGKFDPDTEGLDFYQIHEHGDCPYGLEVRNPATGEVLWGKFVGKDTARGLTANIDPRYRGNQVWSYFGGGLYTYKGELITPNMPQSANFAIWWDGDLQRELLDHKWLGWEVGSGIGQIYKWNWEKEELITLLDTKDAYSNNGSKGNPCIQADLFGDWREEVIWRNEESTELRVYTTTDLTEHKMYTLMHDHVYRLGVAWQNTAYNQPPHTGFYIGEEMDKLPIPNSIY